jgi:hypothetical protein
VFGNTLRVGEGGCVCVRLMQRKLRMVVENDAWEHDMYQEVQRRPQLQRVTSITTGAKLLISNLHFNVSQEDIEELFQEVGELKSALVHFDKSGRSKGTAQVTYQRKVTHTMLNTLRLNPQQVQRSMSNPGWGLHCTPS